MTTISEAVNILRQSLKEDKSDGSYYHSWVCNLAMSFQDEYKRGLSDDGIRTRTIHDISNVAARNFLDSFIS